MTPLLGLTRFCLSHSVRMDKHHSTVRAPLIALAAITALLIPILSLQAASGDTIVEGQGTIEIIQQAEIKNALGNWTLIRPDNSRITMNQSNRYINDQAPSGQYTLLIENADGATAFIRVFLNDDLISTSSVPSVSFKLSKDDRYRIEATYKFTITGKISVTSQPAGVPFAIRGPNDFREEGVTPASYEEAPRGPYSVQYNPPAECQQPNAQSDNLEKDGRIGFSIRLICDALDAMANDEFERQLNYVTLTVGSQKIPLEDAPIDAWFATYVHKVSRTGIMSGYKDEEGNYTGQFGPGDPVSLAQLAKVAHKVAGINENELSGTPKNSRAIRTWFENFYTSAELRYWNVFLDPNIDPARSATRAEVIATLMQALDVPRIWPKGEIFRDVLPNAPYAASIETAAADGIIESSTNAFRPNDQINRAELAKIISLTIDKYIDDSPEITGDYN